MIASSCRRLNLTWRNSAASEAALCTLGPSMLVAAAVCFILIAQLVTHWRNGAQIKTSREWKTRVPAPEGNRPVPGSTDKGRTTRTVKGEIWRLLMLGETRTSGPRLVAFFASGAVKVSLLGQVWHLSPPSSLWAEKQISVA